MVSYVLYNMITAISVHEVRHVLRVTKNNLSLNNFYTITVNNIYIIAKSPSIELLNVMIVLKTK